MYKMVVIDDDYLVRLGIKETIDWSLYNIEIIGTASNGEEGLKIIKTMNPDIIISDVKMPKIGGVELVDTLVKDGYDGIIIILSGYNDFLYVKSTLEKGVFKYLLKPIDNEELINTVLESIEKLDNKRKIDKYLKNLEESVPVIKNNIVDQMFHETNLDISDYQDKMDTYGIDYIDEGLSIYTKFDFDINNNLDSVELKDSIKIIEDELKEILKNNKYIYSKNVNRIAFATDFKDTNLLEKKLVEMIKKYEEKSKILISIGITPFLKFHEISSSFSASKFIANNKLFASINSIEIKTSSSNDKVYKKHIIESLKYISEHYQDKDLNAKSVSNYLYVSESYLMHLFKEELSKTFNTILTEYRIMMAKKLLLLEKYKVYEIAEMVGYQDMKYFSQVFRKLENLTPSEYIKKHNEKRA